MTEDADLGIRLALAGYRVADLPSATLEEAPATGAWLKQRTRWMKGYMQTCITHGRRPAQALRALGFPRFMGAVTMTFGALLAALGYPFFVVHAIVSFANGTLWSGDPFEALQAAVGLTLFVAGLFAMMAPAAVAIRHRGCSGVSLTCRFCPSTMSWSASRPGAASPSCCSTRSAGTRPSTGWPAPRAPACSQMSDQLLRGLLRRPVEVEGADEPTRFVHQIDKRRVLQGVAAVLERRFPGVGAKSLHGRVDPARSPVRPDDALVEAAEIALQNLGGVALGIDGDKRRPQVAAFVAGGPQRLRNLEQLGRTDVRTMRKTEENEMRLARKIAIRHGAAVLIDQREKAPPIAAAVA